jgi:MarR family transcriptional regulator, organic hydroperoxide resistance regulator
VAGRILEELRQSKPFQHVEEEAFLNVQRTADVLMQALLTVLKPCGLSATQYNVLRILRGAGNNGMTCKDIGGRMITPDPDITRLLDRLEKRNLVTRNRAREDRRFVTIQITGDGLELLRQLDEPIRDLQLEMFRGLGEHRVTELVDLLETVRTGTKTT